MGTAASTAARTAGKAARVVAAAGPPSVPPAVHGAVVDSALAAKVWPKDLEPQQGGPQSETLEQLHRRLDSQRPAMFRRLDGRDEAPPAALDAPVGVDDMNEASSLPTRDAEAAAVARRAISHGGAAVSVTRLIPSRVLTEGSGESVATAPSDLEKLHDKSPVTTGNLRKLDEERQMRVVDHADDSAGVRNFKIFQAMQINPSLLDTAAALASSPLQLVAAQMATGFVPASARGEVLQIPPGKLTPAKFAAELDGSAEPGNSLVARASAAEALVPAHATVDSLLLAQPVSALPADVTSWGPRPAETSPYDQLILYPADDEFALDRGEVFELYARHRADPVFWSAARLAEKYNTKVEWVEVMLEFGAPPLFARVDGEAYGVYDVRSMDDLQSQDEAAATATAAAAASSAERDKLA